MEKGQGKKDQEKVLRCAPYAEKTATGEPLATMRAVELESERRSEMLDVLDTFLVSFGLSEPEDSERINLL
jgi:hypothetical protein